jgi:hypothetical protein
VFDPQLNYDNLTGRNRQFLQAALPRIAALMVRSLADGLRRARTVVVGHRSAAFAELGTLAGPQHRVIDLASGAADLAARAGYQGMCW